MERSMSDVRPLRLGLACLARTRFDYAAARDLYLRSVAALKAFEGVELIAPDDLILDNPDDPKPGLVAQASAFFHAAQIDALVIQNGTFTMRVMALELIQGFN